MQAPQERVVPHAQAATGATAVEVSFHVTPGDYDVVVRQTPTRLEPNGAVLFSKRLRVEF